MGFGSISTNLVRLGILVSAVSMSIAQTPPAQPAPPAPPPSTSDNEGKDIGGYHVTQSVELGGRIADVTGSQAMYNTLVNYQTGARILEQSLTMQALTREEFFD